MPNVINDPDVGGVRSLSIEFHSLLEIRSFVLEDRPGRSGLRENVHQGVLDPGAVPSARNFPSNALTIFQANRPLLLSECGEGNPQYDQGLSGSDVDGAIEDGYPGLRLEGDLPNGGHSDAQRPVNHGSEMRN